MVDLATNKLSPRKAEGTIWTGDITYYAKFVAKDTSLVIINSGWNINDTNQTFLYRIYGVAGTESEGIDLTFSIKGNGSMTIAKLPVGEYTVEQITDWSWRYEALQITKQITLSVDAAQNVLEFNNIRATDKWLDGSGNANNVFN